MSLPQYLPNISSMLTRLLDATGAELLSSQCNFRIIALGLPEICLEFKPFLDIYHDVQIYIKDVNYRSSTQRDVKDRTGT